MLHDEDNESAPAEHRAGKGVVYGGHEVVGLCKADHCLKVRDIAAGVAQGLRVDHLHTVRLKGTVGASEDCVLMCHRLSCFVAPKPFEAANQSV